MTTILGIIGAVVIATVILRLVLRRELLVKYATLWLVVSVVLVLMTVIPNSLPHIADLLGFTLPANLLFLAGFILLLCIAVQLSVELTAVERRLQRLAEEVALIKEKAGHDADQADS